jgi:hypothetical protein
VQYEACKTEFAADSLLEEAGFELSVPRKTPSIPGRFRFTFAPTISRSATGESDANLSLGPASRHCIRLLRREHRTTRATAHLREALHPVKILAEAEQADFDEG